MRPGPLLEDLVCCLRWAKSFLWVTVGQQGWLQITQQRYQGCHHEVLLVLQGAVTLVLRLVGPLLWGWDVGRSGVCLKQKPTSVNVTGQ